MKKGRFTGRVLSFLVTAMALLSASCGNPADPSSSEESGLPVQGEVTSPSSSEAEVIPDPVTVTLLGAGDNLIHNGIYLQAQQRASGQGFDFEMPYSDVAPVISSADLAVLNQETVLASEKFALSSYPCFNSPVELGVHMREIGFDVFNHANNHILDQGVAGIEATLDFWNTQPVTAVCGAYRSEEDLHTMRLLSRDGVTFSFLGFTEHMNGLKMPQDSPYRVVLTSETEEMKRLIEEADQVSDVVVVSVHWGVEGSHTVTQAQKDLAQNMVDWGADIILGTHPHVIQPAEYLTRSDGSRGFVIYSMGNFISAQNTARTMVGAMARLQITKTYGENNTSSVEITDAEMIPTVTHYDAGYGNIRVYLLEHYTQDLASKHGVRSFDSSFSYDYVHQLLQDIYAPDFYKEETNV